MRKPRIWFVELILQNENIAEILYILQISFAVSCEVKVSTFDFIKQVNQQEHKIFMLLMKHTKK